MMKIYKIAVILLFLAVSGVFLVTFVAERFTVDTTVPVISLEDDVLELSVNAKDKDFLDGVTAFDEKDGDLTDEIIVESVSRFIEPGVCKVKYAVCDSDNHVAHATRKVRYKNYEPPKFKLKNSLCFSLYENINVAKRRNLISAAGGYLVENIGFCRGKEVAFDVVSILFNADAFKIEYIRDAFAPEW